MSGYTLKLDLTDYQTSALRLLLQTDIDRAERDGVADREWPMAIREIVRQVDNYRDATEAAKAMVAHYAAEDRKQSAD